MFIFGTTHILKGNIHLLITLLVTHVKLLVKANVHSDNNVQILSVFMHVDMVEKDLLKFKSSI